MKLATISAALCFLLLVTSSAAVDSKASNDVVLAKIDDSDEPDVRTPMVPKEEGDAAKRSRASYCVGYCPNGMACIYSGTCATVVPIWCCGTTHCCAHGSRCYFNTCR